MRCKPKRHKPYGFLKQLPIHERPWNSIAMDFIEKLPISSGYDSILVIVDRLSKQSIFVPTYHTITSPELAKLFVLHVFSKHGIPSHITSDRGSTFVSRFFQSLGESLNIKMHYTSGYHPEANGQTERVNQTLEQYLRTYTNYHQDNWSDLLPLAEFAYNNTPNATTGISPFFANKGYHPSFSTDFNSNTLSIRAREFTDNLTELHEQLKNNIAEAQKQYQVQADKHRISPPEFNIGDQVFVKAKYFRTTRPSPKLSERYLGPHTIIEKAGTLSYVLQLPDTFKTVHPVFHVSMLEPFTQNTIPRRTQSPPPPVQIEDELEYELDVILDSKIDNRRRCKLLYLVKWSGYENTEDETSWLPASELDHAQDLITEFHRQYPHKPGPNIR